jgi:hypothetical protein
MIKEEIRGSDFQYFSLVHKDNAIGHFPGKADFMGNAYHGYSRLG